MSWRVQLRHTGVRPRFGISQMSSGPGLNIDFGWWFLAIRKGRPYPPYPFFDLSFGRGQKFARDVRNFRLNPLRFYNEYLWRFGIFTLSMVVINHSTTNWSYLITGLVSSLTFLMLGIKALQVQKFEQELRHVKVNIDATYFNATADELMDRLALALRAQGAKVEIEPNN